MTGLTKSQQAVTKSGLGAARPFGFALAGSGALIVHGLVERPTNDADWFTNIVDPASFDLAVTAVLTRLRADGFTIEHEEKRNDTFWTFTVGVADGDEIEVDMSLDWRRYNPAEISIGPVLDIQDAAASKVATIYSRGAARDFIDLWSIRTSGLWSDAELFAMACDRDEGIEIPQFLRLLADVEKYEDIDFSAYGLTPQEVVGVRTSASDFGDAIQIPVVGGAVLPDHGGDVHVRSHSRERGAVRHYWRRRPARR